ncbi:MAG: hypothetical protein ACFFDK_04185 [Promethearchaeota archaeon]
MNETEKDNSSEPSPSEEQGQKQEQSQRRRSARPARRSQMDVLREALGLKPQDIQEIEKKLFIAKFLDYFKEDHFDFIYKDRSIDFYKREIYDFFASVENEEDKLLKKKFENKQIMDIIIKLKKKAEEIALARGNIKQSIDKRIRNFRIIFTTPMIGILMVFMLVIMFFSNAIPIWYVLPLVCVFCLAPQLIQTEILRKWNNFKEEHRNEFFTENRDDIMVLKDFANEILENIRLKLLDMKVPLQIIKFILHSRDYENMTLLSQGTSRGTNQYVFSFEYPPGMEPFPIPEELLPPQPPKKVPETNFIVLSELKIENGKIKGYVPVLKSMLSDKINSVLNECEFITASENFKTLVPNYSETMAIYCLCGDIAEITSIRICNWKNRFKFYLFESKECQCGEIIYALSKIDEKDKVPTELEDIFSS